MAADLTFDDPVAAAASDALAEMRAEVAENGDGLDHAVVLSRTSARATTTSPANWTWM